MLSIRKKQYKLIPDFLQFVKHLMTPAEMVATESERERPDGTKIISSHERERSHSRLHGKSKLCLYPIG